MGRVETNFIIFGLPIFAMLIHELTHLAVARIAGPFSTECVSLFPFQIRLDFNRMPSQAMFRVIALAPLLISSIVALTAIQTGIWQRIQAADSYYFHHLIAAYWILYVAPSPADIRLAIWPSTEDTDGLQMNPHPLLHTH